ncbi:Phenylalanyl-tRNA synthetase alpha chain [hydrothermal vent metagenome]|uniref:Phenylalanine--tRNA ligase alpha subunit n=1 Tax=hydrothermal vent metagenome TaxID=652676 RepID=A0A3B0VYY0_9ZZZZ
MEAELQRIKEEAEAALRVIQEAEPLEEFRVKYLGRKGMFTALMRNLGQAPKEERPRLGKLANDFKRTLEEVFSAKKSALADSSGNRRAGNGEPDLTLPGRAVPFGKRHPVTQVMEEICSIFERLGFTVAEGPDIELDFYNFEGLNIPKHHPARDMHDTFYVDDNVLLRTHTSPMQVRSMEKAAPPLRMIAPGKVYRCDSDITHTPMFHQVEGFLVDHKVSFADLKGILAVFIARMFDKKTAIRFRPSYFPFTEPSAEVDIACVICHGKGCRVCKQTGWLEILGAGLIDPEVFKKVNYDPEEYSGFAFGLGVERIAMLKYGITDIRLFYENDRRFLKQF